MNVKNIFQKAYNFEKVTFDAELFPPYLPERRGYSQLKFFKKMEDFLIPVVDFVLFFEIKTKAAKRFKTNRTIKLL